MPSVIYEFGEFQLDPDNRTLLRNGVRVHFETKTMDLFILLVKQHGKLLRVGDILEEVWKDNPEIEEGAVRQRISHIRRKLGDKSKKEESLYVLTGDNSYTFICPVREIESAHTEESDNQTSTVVESNQRAFEAENLASIQSSASPKKAWKLVIAMSFLTLLSYYLFVQAKRWKEATPHIREIAPSPIAAIGDQPVMIKGEGFRSGLRAFLYTEDGTLLPTLKDNQIFQVSDKSIIIMIDFNNNGGKYEIEIENYYGKRSNRLPFEVQAITLKPTIFSVSPPEPSVTSGEQEILLVGANFQQNPVIIVTGPIANGDCQHPKSDTGTDASTFIVEDKRQIIYASPVAILSKLHFGYPGQYYLQVKNSSKRISDCLTIYVR